MEHLLQEVFDLQGKRRYRIIDFKRDKDGIPGKITSIEYDPNRTAFIALVTYADGEKRYILAPDEIEVGDVIISGEEAPIRVGNALPLSKIPTGTTIHNIELYPGRGGQLVRSAGTWAQLMAKEGDYAHVRLPSGEIRLINVKCKATIGRVSNLDHENVSSGKAGRTRWLGRRPQVRGTAMNRWTTHMVEEKENHLLDTHLHFPLGVGRHWGGRPVVVRSLLTSSL